MNETGRIDRTRRIKDVLWVLAFVGIVAMVLRFAFGLGATTNLDDHIPWGLWKIFNMVAGAALATSGFTVGFLGHVLHRKPFDRMVRPAILVAFLGYGASLFALLFDIGLPWRFWHPFVFWNPHSFLFEVFWCVSIYFVVTFLELSPTLLERVGLARLRGWLHRAGGVFVIAGITLSSLHHTSLGSLFLVTPQRLHPLWWSPILSLQFIMSAIGGGLLLLALIKTLHSWWYDPVRVFGGTMVKVEGVVCRPCPAESEGGRGGEGPDLEVVRALVVAGSWVLAAYFGIRLADLLLRPEARMALMAGTWESALLVIELMIAVVLPVGMVLFRGVRRSPRSLALAAGLGAAGLALNRMNVGIFGYFRDAGEIYLPSGIEWAITAGVLAMAGLAFFFITEHFSVFDERWKTYRKDERQPASAFDRLTRVWNHRLLTGLERVTLLAMFAVPLAWVALYPPYLDSPADPIRPPLAVDITRDTLRIDGNRAGLDAIFAHSAHQRRLGAEESCSRCHHLTMPTDRATPCSQCHRAMEFETAIFDHGHHIEAVAHSRHLDGWIPGNASCAECHTGPVHSAATAKACRECHQDDMHAQGSRDGRLAWFHADAYHAAMHRTCIPCHAEQAAEQARPELDRCTTCHRMHPDAGREEQFERNMHVVSRMPR